MEERKQLMTAGQCRLERRIEMKVESVHREVIEQKLLLALEDEGTVAILASEQDLEMLLYALKHGAIFINSSFVERRAEMIIGLEKLKEEAF